jgi:hypothetical protein
MTDARIATVSAAVDRSLSAYAILTELGEEIDDEWSYVQDLSTAWRDRLEGVAAARGDEPVDPAVAAAIQRAIDEIWLIADPHRAIDWLSTFPQVALTALGETP